MHRTYAEQNSKRISKCLSEQQHAWSLHFIPQPMGSSNPEAAHMSSFMAEQDLSAEWWQQNPCIVYAWASSAREEQNWFLSLSAYPGAGMDCHSYMQNTDSPFQGETFHTPKAREVWVSSLFTSFAPASRHGLSFIHNKSSHFSVFSFVCKTWSSG